MPVVRAFLEEMRIRRGYRLTPVLSVECEKTRSELLELVPLADVVFVSKEHAKFNGCDGPEEAVRKFSDLAGPMSGLTVVCPWGEAGAWAGVCGDEAILHSPAFKPEKVVDTLGAGDTFIGAFIFARLSCGLKESLEFACRVAGAKCGQVGYYGLAKFVDTLESAGQKN